MRTFRLTGRRARGLVVLMALLDVLTLGGAVVVLAGDAKAAGQEGPLGTPVVVWILLGILCGVAPLLTAALLRHPPELASDGGRLLIRGALDPLRHQKLPWDRIEAVRLTRPAGSWALSVEQKGTAGNVIVPLAEFPLPPRAILELVETAAPPGVSFDDAGPV